jgi:hypothetical protein
MAICSECGSIVPEGVLFCRSCGKRVDLSAPIRPMPDGGEQRVIVRPSRAETQRRPLSPFDEQRPLYFEYTLESQRARSPYPSREQAVLDDDDDEEEGPRRPNKPAAMPVQRETPPYAREPRRQAARVPYIGTMEYLFTLFVMLVPVIGFVLCILWAARAANPLKRIFAKACAVFVFILYAVGFGIFALNRWVF